MAFRYEDLRFGKETIRWRKMWFEWIDGRINLMVNGENSGDGGDSGEGENSGDGGDSGEGELMDLKSWKIIQKI